MARIPIKYKWLSDEGIKYMMDVKNRFLTFPLVNPKFDVFFFFLLLQLARAVAGDLMKKIFFGLGPINCGKIVEKHVICLWVSMLVVSMRISTP